MGISHQVTTPNMEAVTELDIDWGFSRSTLDAETPSPVIASVLPFAPRVETPEPSAPISAHSEPLSATPEPPAYLSDGPAPWQQDEPVCDDANTYADVTVIEAAPAPTPVETKVEQAVTTDGGAVSVFTAEQRADILRILNNEKDISFESRAGKLMRECGHLFSPAANVVYRNICGFMGISMDGGRLLPKDQVAVDIERMTPWLPLGRKSIENAIQEITLTGALPLIEKTRPGGLGKRTIYGFVCDPFALAARQAEQAKNVKPNKKGHKRNAATRRAIVITGDAPTASPTPAREPQAVPVITARKLVTADRDLDGFETLANAYPRPESREDAKKEYRKALAADPEVLPKMLAALEWQRKQDEWKRDEGRWVPHLDKWIRNKGWDLSDPQAKARAEIDARRKAERERMAQLLAERGAYESVEA